MARDERVEVAARGVVDGIDLDDIHHRNKDGTVCEMCVEKVANALRARDRRAVRLVREYFRPNLYGTAAGDDLCDAILGRAPKGTR